MTDFEDNEQEYEEFDDQIMFLYLQLMNMPYSETDVIAETEQSLYTEMATTPDDTLGFIAFMQAETMLGNHDKAKALAYKIWEKGSQLLKMEEYLYINNLINIGLLDMASVLLKPKLENLMAHIEDYYPIMLKIAIMTGNIPLAERLISNPEAPEREDILQGIITYFKNENYVEKFKTVQKIILENTKDNLCSYEYDIITGEEDIITVSLYLNGDEVSLGRIYNEINDKLNIYYQGVRISRIPCFDWEILPIDNHLEEGLGSED